MNETLQAVERYAPVGLTPPQLLRLPGLMRRAARALARLALVPLRLVTGPQRRFNEAVLAALRELAQHARYAQAIEELRARATTLEYNRDELYPAVQALQHHQPTFLSLPDRAAAAERRLADLEAEKEQTTGLLYATRVNLAHREWQAANLHRARATLEDRLGNRARAAFERAEAERLGPK